jgi:monofunctional biosynthetic peptidoglycan transglycosylase
VRKLRKRLRRMARWGIALAALGFVYIGYVYLTLPDVRPLATNNPQTTAFMELRKREAAEAGRTLTIRQRWVPYTQISNNLRRAVLVAEDSAFFDHDGVDLNELRASLERNWEEGSFTRGASTITQQLAKNLYLSPSRNPIRKLKELMITRRLEAELSKRRILEIYLNVIEWGDGIFGAEAAARAYFGKPASALEPDEAALLAGAIINPREHSPARPTARLKRRQQIIARRMGIKPTPPPALERPAPAGESPTSTTELPQTAPDPTTLSPVNTSPPEPPETARPLKPRVGNGVPTPITPGNPKGSARKTAADGAILPPQLWLRKGNGAREARQRLDRAALGRRRQLHRSSDPVDARRRRASA